MPSWVLLIIVIASLIGLYLVAVIIIYFLMKRAQKRAFSALDSMVTYEKERMHFVNDLVTVLNTTQYKVKDNIRVVVDEQNEMLSSDRVDMNKVKQQTDFLLIYLQKYLKEKGIRKKSPFDTYFQKIPEYLVMDIESDKYPYKDYNKIATKYNSFLSLGFLSPFARSSKNPQAPIL